MADIKELTGIPDVSFIDGATLEDIKNEMVSAYETAYETATGETITLEADAPMRIALYTAAAYLYQTMQYVDRGGKQDLLKYSYGSFLDNIVALKGVTRMDAAPASTTLRFTLSAAQTSAVPIPTGTRATAESSGIFFETAEYAEVPIGEMSVDVPAQCTAAGAAGNGYVINALSVLVDPVAFMESVTNISATSGGSDIETDSELAQRAFIAPSSYSTAGPEPAYEYWAQQFNGSIGDIKVDANVREAVSRTVQVYGGHAFIGGNHLDTDTLAVYPAGGTTAATAGTDYTADYAANLLDIEIITGGGLASQSSIDVTIQQTLEGRVNIYALMEDGSLPDTAEMAAIEKAFNTGEVKPMTDEVKVIVPTEVDYSISLTYWIDSANSATALSIQTAVAKAVSDYKVWQRHIGRDINPSKLIALVMAAGAKRVSVTAPVNTVIAPESVAKLSGTATVTYGGLEDD